MNVTRSALSIVLALLLGAMFLSLFNMSVGMDMTGGMSDCPFTTHEEVVCTMNFSDHIGAWKTAFTAIAPSLVLLLFAFAAVAIVFDVASNLLLRQKYLTQQLSRDVRERIYSFSYRQLQELFSNGILHPKLF